MEDRLLGAARIRPEMLKITVRFQAREDGGLRAWSDDVPGFILSHSDSEAVLNDVEPALEAILSAKFGTQVMVAPLSDPEAFSMEPPLQIERRVAPSRREYASQLAA